MPSIVISRDRSDKAADVVIFPEQGDRLDAFHEEVIVDLGGAQTGGKLSLWTETTLPGGGPPSRYHANEDKVFFVQEGKNVLLA
jgi:hypothetical protein